MGRGGISGSATSTVVWSGFNLIPYVTRAAPDVGLSEGKFWGPACNVCNGVCGSLTPCRIYLQAGRTVPWSGFNVIPQMTCTTRDRGLPEGKSQGAACDVHGGACRLLTPCSRDLQADGALVRDACNVISYVTRAARDGGHSEERLWGSTCGVCGGAGGPLFLSSFANLARIWAEFPLISRSNNFESADFPR